MNSTAADFVSHCSKHGSHAEHMNHTGHAGHNHGGSSGCKTDMLWNWHTIDACFLTSSWHITSAAMFAGSCIGVFVFACVTVLLRRLATEYDAYLTRTLRSQIGLHVADATAAFAIEEKERDRTDSTASDIAALPLSQPPSSAVPRLFMRPGILQQLLRSLLYVAQVFSGYILMLLAMYYNGYIIISILLGFFFGFYVVEWRRLGDVVGQDTQQHAAHC